MKIVFGSSFSSKNLNTAVFPTVSTFFTLEIFFFSFEVFRKGGGGELSPKGQGEPPPEERTDGLRKLGGQVNDRQRETFEIFDVFFSKMLLLFVYRRKHRQPSTRNSVVFFACKQKTNKWQLKAKTFFKKKTNSKIKTVSKVQQLTKFKRGFEILRSVCSGN